MPASLLTVTPLTASGISHVADNIPQPGLILWLDASKIAGIASGTSLSAWTDSSAAGSHATQASAGSQPSYLTGQQNGLAVVNFPAGGKAVLFAVTSTQQPVTLAAAYKSTTTTGDQTIVSGTGGNGSALALSPSGGFYRVFAGGPVNVSAYTSTAWVTHIGIFNGSSTTASISGKTVVGDPGALGGTSLIIGAQSVATQWLNGPIGEILVYNRNLTELERTSVETYLRSKWGTL